MLNVVRLQVLAAVARTGSVGAAATELNYSQPSVSHHLARLEAETGARLIRRAGRGIALTSEGELLALRAREIIARLDSADAELAATLDARTGLLRVAAFQSALGMLVPAAASAVRATRPDLHLELIDTHPVEAVRQLHAGTADVALLFGYEDLPPWDGLHCTHLLDDPVYLVTNDKRLRLADHRESSWIAGCEHCRAELTGLCATAGFEPRIDYRSEDIVTDQALVAAGLGVTTLPGLALRSFRNPEVQVRAVPGRRRRVVVATVDDAPQSATTAQFVEALQQVARRYRSSRGTPAR